MCLRNSFLKVSNASTSISLSHLRWHNEEREQTLAGDVGNDSALVLADRVAHGEVDVVVGQVCLDLSKVSILSYFLAPFSRTYVAIAEGSALESLLES